MKRQAKITIEIEDKTIDISVDKADAFHVLDNLLGRVRPIMASHVASPKPIFPQEISSVEVKLKVPERSLIEEYIKTKDGYGFSVGEIINHFVGNELSKLNEKDAYNWRYALYAKLTRIRKTIADSEKGKWLSAGRGDDKTFKFVKENAGEIKSAGGEQLKVENY